MKPRENRNMIRRESRVSMQIARFGNILKLNVLEQYVIPSKPILYFNVMFFLMLLYITQLLLSRYCCLYLLYTILLRKETHKAASKVLLLAF